jgi:hypothetical protein
MKKLMLMLSIVAALSLGLAACGEKADNTDDGATSQPAQTATDQGTKMTEGAGEDLAAARDAYVAKAEELLNEVGSQLPSYKDKVAALPGPAKTTAEKTVSTLESAQATAKETLTKVKEASPENWQDVKPEMDKALGDVSSAFDKVKSLF